MALDELLAAFRQDVEAFARHQAIAEQARLQAADFPPEAVEQVIADNRDASLDALARVCNAVPVVEEILHDERERLRALEQERVEVEYALDGLELEQSIGAIDDGALSEGEVTLRGRLDALADEVARRRDTVARIVEVLDRWYDIGAEHAITA